MTKYSPFIRNFSTRINQNSVERISGHYDDESNVWVNGTCGMSPSTRKKSAKVLSEDESSDW